MPEPKSVDSISPKLMGLGPKSLFLILGLALSSLGLGFSLSFALGTFFALFFALLVTSFATVLALTVPSALRWGTYAVSAILFVLPHFTPIAQTEIPIPFLILLAFFFLLGVAFLDLGVGSSRRLYAVFASRLFSGAFTRFFLFLVFSIGILTYFVAAPAGRFDLQELVGPFLDPVVELLVTQVESQLGTEFTTQEFLDQLRRSELLPLLEEQFGIKLEESQVLNPEALRKVLRDALSGVLIDQLDAVLGPFLNYLPLIAAATVALSLLFLTPLFSLLAVGAFALTYRLLVGLKIVKFVEEERKVRILTLG